MERPASLKEIFIDEQSKRLYKLVVAVAIPLAILIAILGDANIAIYINTHRPRVLDPFFAFYTDWGNHIMMVIFISFLIASFATERLKKYRPLTLSILIAGILVNLVVVRFIKIAVNRTRPHCVYGLECVGANPGCGLSFPSGHTSEAFTYATPLMAKFKNAILRASLLCYAALMGFSRIYAGVHYPSDVLAGAVIAVLLSYWIYRICEYYSEQIEEFRTEKLTMILLFLAAVIAIIVLFFVRSPYLCFSHNIA